MIDARNFKAALGDNDDFGGLRDIFVRQTDLEDWQKLLDLFRARSYPVKYDFGGEERPVPDNEREVLEAFSDISVCLSIFVGKAMVNLHFLSDDEIEMDIAPSEGSDERTARLLIDFLERAGRTLDKDVLLTEENGPDAVLVRYDSVSGQVVKGEYWTKSPT